MLQNKSEIYTLLLSNFYYVSIKEMLHLDMRENIKQTFLHNSNYNKKNYKSEEKTNYTTYIF